MKIPTARYTCEHWREAERQRLWSQTWNLVAHQDQLDSVGDMLLFTLNGIEIIVVHNKQGNFSAFYNSCPHRGTRLIERQQSASVIRCPYHNWTFSLAGRCIHMGEPSPQPEPCLHSVKCDVAMGFVWVNLCNEATPLAEYVTEALDWSVNYQLDKLHCHSILESTLEANWKTSVDAHNEVYHLHTLHPELLNMVNDMNVVTKLGRSHALLQVPLFEASTRYPNRGPTEPVPDHRTVRSALRKEAIATLKDEELSQIQLMYIFPNVQLNLRHNEILVFSHYPHPNDNQKCIFRQYLLRPQPTNKVTIQQVEQNDSKYGAVTGADLHIVGQVQAGLNNNPNGFLTLTAQESIIEYMHQQFCKLGLSDA